MRVLAEGGGTPCGPCAALLSEAPKDVGIAGFAGHFGPRSAHAMTKHSNSGLLAPVHEHPAIEQPPGLFNSGLDLALWPISAEEQAEQLTSQVCAARDAATGEREPARKALAEATSAEANACGSG